MLGKSVKIKSKLQEKKKGRKRKRRKDLPLSFFSPFSYNIYKVFFCYDANIFGIFRHCCDRLVGWKREKDKKPPNRTEEEKKYPVEPPCDD